MIYMKTKICSKCKQEKDIIFFAKRKDSKDGYRNICKECDNKLHKKYKLICEHCGKEFYGQATQKKINIIIFVHKNVIINHNFHKKLDKILIIQKLVEKITIIGKVEMLLLIVLIVVQNLQ